MLNRLFPNHVLYTTAVMLYIEGLSRRVKEEFWNELVVIMNLSSSCIPSERQIVLLGQKNAGKSSAGNTILGKREFDLRKTVHCVKACNEINGTKITVVDTPGWWKNLPFEENPELCKQEILLSVTKCPPGPHVLLLVLNVNTTFQEDEKDILCDNIKCFGEEVWRHTIVLLTCEDQPEVITTQQLIENKNLQWLIGKCGNRYHELNTKNWGDGSQVTELLKKIQEMVEGNRGGHYEMNRETLQHVEEKRREQEKRAEKRKIKNQLTNKTRKTGDKHPLSERMVLLGYNGSGKSSAGNNILGKPAFDSKRSLMSVVREGDVSGRHIIVVDTPGRRRNYCSKYTPRLYKDEIVLSPSLCPPGPHVFLLVIRVDVSFTEVYRRAVEEHAACHGNNIWDHMIVLFTFGDWLGNTDVELFIESEGEALQWIIDKCGNRYHVFNNKNKDDGNQVTELFEKIEMVAGQKNEECCFMIDYQHLQEVKDRRMKVEKRAKHMKDEMQKNNKLRNFMPGDDELSEMRLVLLGSYCCNKSSTGNTILGRKAFNRRRSEENREENGEVAGRKLTVVYTPSFEKDYVIGKRLEDAKLNILRSVTESTSGTHAFILVQSVESSFADEEKSALEKIMEPLGERVWDYMLVLFTVGAELGETPVELFIASEGDALQWLIKKCGNRYHVLNTKNWGDGTQVTELLEKIEEMVAANRGQHYETDRKTLQCVEEKRRAEETRMKNQQLEYDVEKETLERVERTDPISNKRARSMDIPLNIAEGCSLSSEISGYVSMSISSKETPEKLHFNKTLCSEMTSGLESLDSIPDSDEEPDIE